MPNNASNIPVDIQITWAAVPGASGYLFSLGTTPGGVDIVNSRRSDIAENFFPNETGLPENTQLYVTFGIFLPDGSLFNCPGITFRTEEVTTPPSCTTLSALNGSINVDTDTQIEWNYAPRATGYDINIGLTPGGNEIIANEIVSNRLSFTPPNGFPIDTEIYVTITPFNAIGAAVNCTSQSFITGLVDTTCDPFFNFLTGIVERPRPDINFPNQIYLCETNVPSLLVSQNISDGHRWYRINDDTSETLLSDLNEVTISQTGNYRYEAFNLIGATECANSILFSVLASEQATITNVDVSRVLNVKTVEIRVSGSGIYEFSLDSSSGPYQDNPVFTELSRDSHTIYVRDKNGCGIVETFIERDLTIADFPKFFTPNGDGINDFWQFIPPRESNGITLEPIHIFNRFGLFIKQIDPTTQGWDGTFNGRPLPASDYWFRAVDNFNMEFKGHFTLKR